MNRPVNEVNARQSDSLRRSFADLPGSDARNDRYTVVVVADHARLRHGLATHLAASPQIRSVIAVRSSDDLEAVIGAADPSMVVIDEQLNGDVWSLCRRLISVRPSLRCLIVGNGLAPDVVSRARRAGAADYIAKSLTNQTVRQAVEAVLGSDRDAASLSNGPDADVAEHAL
jgi:DNA-binding NarL/FixJ family response regulator